MPTGGKIELLLIRPKGEKIWEALVRPSRRVSRGTRLVFGQGELTAQIREKTDTGVCIVRFTYDGDFQSILARVGQMPLPPYIKRENPRLEIESGINVYTLQPKAQSPPQPQACTSRGRCWMDSNGMVSARPP